MPAFLFDLDGTLYTDRGPVPGAVDLLRSLKRSKVPYRYVTNTTSRPRAAVVERLRGYGFDAEAQEIVTAVMAGAKIARGRGCRVLAPFVAPATLPDLGEFELVGGTSGRPPSSPPECVLIGDLGERWEYALMQEAFRYVMAGAGLIALSRDRYWMRGDGLALDAGPFVVGLEFATGRDAVVAGKPSREFFGAAGESLGPAAPNLGPVIMVGDDIWSDIHGAQQAGYRGWLVQTGKYREEALKESGVTPDRVIRSVADCADLLG